MKTIVEKIDSEEIDSNKIEAAARIIKSKGVVAFPTETVYGLGADALSREAAAQIYAAKGRPPDNPLIVHIADIEDLKKITDEIPEKAIKLGKKFWPGPLTMIFKKNEIVPLETTGGLNTVAVRIPDHPVALALIRASTGFVAAPSANTSGKPSPTTAGHVAFDMDGKIPMILDGGKVGIGIESTIVDFSEGMPTILRPGCITKEMIEKEVGNVRMDPGLLDCERNVKPKAPGMKYRHYAPKAGLLLVSGEEERMVETINKLTKEDMERGKKVGIIGTLETKEKYKAGIVKTIGARSNEETIAKNLYSVLREFDDLDVDVIYSESFTSAGIGQAIMNRMLKAAGHQIMEV